MNFHREISLASLFNMVNGSIFKMILLVAILFMEVSAQAMSDAHQKGMSLAKDIPLPQPGSPESVPGYAGTNLPQSQIRAHDLGEEALKTSQGSEAVQLISESFEKGEKFVIDPHTDPLIVAGNEIINDPQKALDETIVESEDGEEVTEETKTCEEAGDETLEECEELRVVTVKEPTGLATHRVDIWADRIFFSGESCNVITGQGVNSAPYYYFTTSNPFPTHLIDRVDHVQMVSTTNTNQTITALWVSPDGTFSFSRWGVNSLSPFTVSSDIFYKPLPTEEDVTETISDHCHHWEDRVEKGLCSYEDVVVIEGPQTRVINGYAVSRDWWRRKKIYRCHYPAKNDCSALRAKGCYQVNSACKEKVRDTCVVWEQTYRCPSGKIKGKSYRSSNKDNPFCLSGDCADKSYEPNQDFAQVMSQMSVLQEAGEDLRNFGSIFKGLDWRCTRHCVGFKDCCGNGNGWGVSLKLASCDKSEKTLAELRKQNRCIQVGTYCAEKKLGVCIRKKTTFCCYDTKLAKIVQEQGKRQLGLGFGDPKQPQCQGLTIEQLAQLDFSKIDFSDMLADIMASTKTPSSEKLMSGIQISMQDRGTLLKIKENSGDESVAVNESTKVAPEVIKNPSVPLPPLFPKNMNKQVGTNMVPTIQTPQDHQIQGRSHGQF